MVALQDVLWFRAVLLIEQRMNQGGD
ncbi:hypothetical protein MIPYR_40021 [uncultured Microbacterium sp.]|uniref:Uncharacterized protein n=1 Tax=uncultured Microbacterium sp. TaxID=191216 RepID=A0A1Y5P3D6_9MICO|nr:hypothetical protein MIPYR_40021 [uncultured Microbacterium sp.]